MLTYLTHPQHGTHIAYNDFEIADCIKNGWTVRGETPPAAELAEPSGTIHVEPAEAQPKRPVLHVKRGPGRPKKVR